MFNFSLILGLGVCNLLQFLNINLLIFLEFFNIYSLLALDLSDLRFKLEQSFRIKLIFLLSCCYLSINHFEYFIEALNTDWTIDLHYIILEEFSS